MTKNTEKDTVWTGKKLNVCLMQQCCINILLSQPFTYVGSNTFCYGRFLFHR